VVWEKIVIFKGKLELKWVRVAGIGRYFGRCGDVMLLGAENGKIWGMGDRKN